MLGGACLMPGVPLKLIKLDGAMRPQIYGLADSGCDFSNFPIAWAQDLGVDLAACVETEGNTAGGTAKKYLYPPGVDALVFGRKIHLSAFFSPGLPLALLGREDFFCYFRASFDQRSSSFQLDAYEPFDPEPTPGDFSAVGAASVQ
jgi:hypothetical protein